MSNNILAYYLALASSLCFSGASLVFADISRKVSPLWMNAYKAIFAWFCFLITVLVMQNWIPMSGLHFSALFGSGILGLAIGDIFLLTAYARMGAARTLILYGFQPLFIAVEAYVFFGQEISWTIAIAVVFFLLCLFAFSLEKFKQDGHWELLGLAAALIGVMLDNAGLMLSRWVFDSVPGIDAFQVNLVRCSGALAFFILFGRVKQMHMAEGFRRLGRKGQITASVAAFLGCFLSLCLYLTAIKIGHMASIAGLGVVGPILASTMECIYYRKLPSRYLLVALALFIAGFATLVLL